MLAACKKVSSPYTGASNVFNPLLQAEGSKAGPKHDTADLHSHGALHVAQLTCSISLHMLFVCDDTQEELGNY